jgi:hypothetical protein
MPAAAPNVIHVMAAPLKTRLSTIVQTASAATAASRPRCVQPRRGSTDAPAVIARTNTPVIANASQPATFGENANVATITKPLARASTMFVA